MIILTIGILPFTLIDEVPSTPMTEHENLDKHFMAPILHVWKSDSHFRMVVYSLIFMTMSLIAQSFYILDFSQRFFASGTIIGRFTTIGVVAGAFTIVLFGYLSDHYGNRLVLILGSSFGMVGSALALCHPGILGYYSIFLCTAASLSALGLSGFNLVIECSNSSDKVPLYTTAFNTILSPFRGFSPIIGGIVADRFGFGTLYWVATISGVLALMATLRLKDPRHLEEKMRG
jgi:MFS family permease